MYGPDPKNKHPMEGFPQVCYIKNTVENPNIIIGDYTYYDDPENSEDFERNVLYHLCDRTPHKIHHERRKPQAFRHLHLSIPNLWQRMGKGEP